MSADDRTSRQAGGDAVAVRDPRVPAPPGRSPNGVHLEVSAPANGSGNGHARTTAVDVPPAAAEQEDGGQRRMPLPNAMDRTDAISPPAARRSSKLPCCWKAIRRRPRGSRGSPACPFGR